MVEKSEFQSKILRHKSSPDEYRVYRAGLEWDLADPIVIESPKDFKSTKRWSERLTPYHHQVTNLITFCRRLPVTLLADDVGLGKTISAGLIICELIARLRLTKILIVCPKLLGPQWQVELREKFDVPAQIAIGRELVSADPEEIGAVITTYGTARLHLDAIPEDRFQMLILDEAHKLRNLYGVENPPQVAMVFRKALEQRRFRFVLMLTATPIQNRLWDLYSLADLLAVARGHENPFGSNGQFARRFIGDSRDQARQLKAEARDEFRSIIYGYMSRVRRGDAKLYFPDRVVQMHRVNPTPAELELIEKIAKPVQTLNRLAQISVLQALTSSPEALAAQLENMARNGSIAPEVATAVRAVVSRMPPSAKLLGLERLIDQLKKENLERWRLVVFTRRRETQTTIQLFLEKQGLKVGIINGDSGTRNQETIARFRKNPPDYRVVVSTEAGSEGVNLQVANVLVNYDLPWNPMIVEQRIGRVQRLGSDHAHVSIFNIMLRGTFEEYIVGRLMEKLQMASHAVGDIEALLQGSDIGGGEEDATAKFEHSILALVLAALAGKDIQTETRLAEESIEKAKAELEREEANINAMLGGTDGAGYVGPRAPMLPVVERSMESREFTLSALNSLGIRIRPHTPDTYLIEENTGREYIRFEQHAASNIKSTLYAPGSPAFQRLVARIIATGVHDVQDADQDPARKSEEVTRQWIADLGARMKGIEIENVRRCFSGNALLRVRATVAHDNYERLVDVAYSPAEHCATDGYAGLTALGSVIERPIEVGVDSAKLAEAASRDDAISEFCRFYLERRDQETRAAGGDERKRKKLLDEFTPRLDITLVALKGQLHREIRLRVRYAFDSEPSYESLLTVLPHKSELSDVPELAICSQSGRKVPRSCLAKCEITGADVLRHLLAKSEVSGRLALPKFTLLCALTNKRILKDEVAESAVTGRLIAEAFLKTSTISGKRAEPEHFDRCYFTGSEVLKTELKASEISGMPYRFDHEMRSAISGKAGHIQEFTNCYVTGLPIAKIEAETCEVTGQQVRPGTLETCAVSGKHVLPSELERCAATGKQALKKYLVTSSLSQARVLESVAIRSGRGAFCAPAEARQCFWSSRISHPDDLRTCALTGLLVHIEFCTNEGPPRLLPLAEMLDGIRRTADENQLWEDIRARIVTVLRTSKCRVEAAALSPTKQHLAFCAEIRTFLGMRVRYAGSIYSIISGEVIGRIVEGRNRKFKAW